MVCIVAAVEMCRSMSNLEIGVRFGKAHVVGQACKVGG